MHRFYWECGRVADEELRALAIGLDLDETYLAKKHSGDNHHLRLLHYLPIPAEDLEKGRASRCMAKKRLVHSDASSSTVPGREWLTRYTSPHF